MTKILTLSIMTVEMPSFREKPMEEFEKKFSNEKEVSLNDLEQMKERGITTEEFLNFLAKKHGYLFHGSQSELAIEEKLVSKEGKLYAADNPAIAILKSIYSNKGKGLNLDYPYHISEENPLKLKITGINPDTIGELGYVYVIDQKEGYVNDPPGSWQYEKKGMMEKQEFLQRYEIEKDDFKYPVEIVEENGK